MLPSQGGITNARGLAGMYAPLAMGGERLVDADTLEADERGQFGRRRGCDAAHRSALRPGFLEVVGQSAGTAGAQDSMILSEEAFGHPGMGGSLGFADPARADVVRLHDEQAGPRRLSQ